ncbi:MFS transporter [Candidatus Poribacteria bacterium]|nr:MFS transporter [Candidatus Poribacteria bacterium]
MKQLDTAESHQSEKLSLKTHLSYGASQFGLNCIGTAYGINLLFFYTTILKFDTALFGIVMLIGQVWDAFSDPMMGYISDNTQWKSGRRRPYFLLGSIPTGIMFFLIFSPPPLGSSSTIFVYLTITTLIFYTGRTVFETPYLALAPELTLDYNERTKLSGYKQLLGTLGDAQGAILPLVLFSVLHEQRRTAHFVYGLIGCAMMIALSALTRWGTFEKPNHARQAAVSVKESFKAVARNRPYLIFIFTGTLATISNNIVTYLVLFITKYWFLDESLATKFFTVFFIGAVCSVPFWMWISNALGKKWSFIMNLTGYGLLLAGIFIIPRTAHTLVTVFMFFAGMFNVGMWILSGAISPDIIEWDEYHTGKRREGVYSGVWTFVYKAGVGMALMFVGFALKVIHFDADLPAQTPSTLLGLKFLFGPASALMLLTAALVFTTFPITKQKHDEIRRLIRERKSSETTGLNPSEG